MALKFIPAAAFLYVISACSLHFIKSQASGRLSFSADSSSFKIAIFADLHYGENAWTDWGPLQDMHSDNVMSIVLDSEKPDFVIYLGDLITANNLPTRNASSYWKRVLSASESRNIPWASVFGNHDDMAFEWPSEWFGTSGMPSFTCPSSSSAVLGSENLSKHSLKEIAGCSGNEAECYFQRTTRAELIQVDMEETLSCTACGDRSLWPSVSNFVLEIACNSNTGNSTCAFLYFLDSGGGSYPEVISAHQADWFMQTSAKRNPTARVPEIVFWHIPSQAYKKVGPKPGGAISQPCVGSINLESVAAQEAEWGIMDILANRTSVKAIVVGHNHGLDWCCPFKKLWLCFARHSGYGGYGSWARGARILELNKEPFKISSWIRMESGTTHSNIDLTSI